MIKSIFPLLGNLVLEFLQEESRRIKNGAFIRRFCFFTTTSTKVGDPMAKFGASCVVELTIQNFALDNCLSEVGKNVGLRNSKTETPAV